MKGLRRSMRMPSANKLQLAHVNRTIKYKKKCQPRHTRGADYHAISMEKRRFEQRRRPLPSLQGVTSIPASSKRFGSLTEALVDKAIERATKLSPHYPPWLENGLLQYLHGLLQYLHQSLSRAGRGCACTIRDTSTLRHVHDGLRPLVCLLLVRLPLPLLCRGCHPLSLHLRLPLLYLVVGGRLGRIC